MRRAIVPATLLTLIIVALQLEVLSSLRFAGVVVMLVWLWPLAVGLTGFTSLALWVALVGGVFFDTHATTPFGLTALVGMILAYGASRLGKEGIGDLDSAAMWVTPALGALGGLVAPFIYCATGVIELNFQLWRGSLLASMVVNACAFFLLARPFTRLAKVLSNVGERARR